MKIQILLLIFILTIFSCTDDKFKCDDFISYMTMTVDEFENDLKDIPLEKTGKFTMKSGYAAGKEFVYRKYSLGNLALDDYMVWYHFPNDEDFAFETNSIEVVQHLKKIVKDCGFVFKSQTDNQCDILSSTNYDCEISICRKKMDSVTGEKTVHSFWFRKLDNSKK